MQHAVLRFFERTDEYMFFIFVGSFCVMLAGCFSPVVHVSACAYTHVHTPQVSACADIWGVCMSVSALAWSSPTVESCLSVKSIDHLL